MSLSYTVGRGSAAQIRTPKTHDTVGKLHLRLEASGPETVTITDLESTNGTFWQVKGRWAEIKGTRELPLDAELMLGDYRTTPRALLATAPASPPPLPGAKKKYRSTKEEGAPPAKKRTGPRRNEFGEIVTE